LRTYLCLGALISLPLFGQENLPHKDLRLWTGVKVEKTLWKDWTFSLEEEIRFKNHVSELSNLFTEAGIQYRINKNFRMSGAYRFTHDKKRDSTFRNLSRTHFDLRYRGRLQDFSIHYRFRIQKEVESGDMFKREAPFVRQLRNRIGVRYKLVNWCRPFVSAEYLRVFSPYFASLNDYWRFQLGARLEPGKVGQFKLAWGFNQELFVADPAMIYMFRVNYTYSF